MTSLKTFFRVWNMDEEGFYTFMRTICVSAAEKMEEEKITKDLVNHLTDEELSKYLPRHGDRIRLRSQLRQQETPKTKKNKLLAVLQQKLDAERQKKSPGNTPDVEAEDMRNPHRPFGNRNAAKQARQIELGWIHKSSQRSIQIRKNKGGGTRKTMVPKTATKAVIIEEAIALFFPNGISSKGPLSKFNCDLWDFADRVIDADVTVADMYEATKLPILRFYLATSQKTTPMPGSSMNTQDHLQPSGSEPMDDSTVIAVPDDNGEDTNQGDILGSAMEMAGLPMTADDDDMLPAFTDDPSQQPGEDIVPVKHTLKLHRGHLMRECIESFKDIDPLRDTVSIQMVMPNGRLETAEDGGGVTRDALSEFWTAFYDQCTLGTKFRVPFLRHDFAEREWQAVGNIILFGWESCQYFPIQLSLPFLQLCLHGQPSANILDAFFEIIPEDEAVTLRKALSDWEEVDQEDLIDLLEIHECKLLPTSDNISRLLHEIAHKEIIQTPMFIVDCIQPILKHLQISDTRLIKLYTDLIPTTKLVRRMIEFPEPMSAEEQTVANHLKRLIRELNGEALRKFVRFCTGSDLMVSKAIKVEFVSVSGLARRPVAHTCSCLLELSKSYESFPQFKSEFMAVLESNVWVMDII